MQQTFLIALIEGSPRRDTPLACLERIERAKTGCENRCMHIPGRAISAVHIRDLMTGFASLGELLGRLLAALAAGLLTVVGVLTENAAVADLLAGQSVFGLWELGMGALLLYVGVYMLGYRQVWLGLCSQFAN